MAIIKLNVKLLVVNVNLTTHYSPTVKNDHIFYNLTNKFVICDTNKGHKMANGCENLSVTKHVIGDIHSV